MKILHLPLWVPNKNDVQLGNFIQQHISISASNNEIHSLEFIADETIDKIILSNHPSVTRITYPKSTNRFINLFWYLKAAKLAAKELKEIGFEPDIVHCHVAGRNLWMAQKYYPNVPRLLSEHWSGYVNGNFEKQSVIYKKYVVRLINKCDLVTSVSTHLRESLISHGVQNEIILLQNVIKFKKKIKINDSEKLNFLMVADLFDEAKNVSGVIEAMNQLGADYPGFRLNIIGDGPDMLSLKNSVKQLKMDDKITFLGRLVQSEVQNHLIDADCLIVNSNYETYSMVTIESILTGCPVIATRCGGPEQFVNAENGILIPKSNLKQLQRAMTDFHQNRMSYGPERVRDSVREDYSESRLEVELNIIYSRFRV